MIVCDMPFCETRVNESDCDGKANWRTFVIAYGSLPDTVQSLTFDAVSVEHCYDVCPKCAEKLRRAFEPGMITSVRRNRIEPSAEPEASKQPCGDPQPPSY